MLFVVIGSSAAMYRKGSLIAHKAIHPELAHLGDVRSPSLRER